LKNIPRYAVEDPLADELQRELVAAQLCSATPCRAAVYLPVRGAVFDRHTSGLGSRSGPYRGGAASVILAPRPCVFHQRFFTQSIQGGGARMTPAPAARFGSIAAALHLARGLGRPLFAQVREIDAELTFSTTTQPP
jgi:hypothetical protein